VTRLLLLLLWLQQHRWLAHLLRDQARAPWLCGAHICDVLPLLLLLLLLLLLAMPIATHKVARGSDCPSSELRASPCR
jgi:hypothetical protein